MFDKLNAVEAQYERLMAEMADPAVQADTTRFRSHSKALSEMQPLVERFREYRAVIEQLTATEELMTDADRVSSGEAIAARSLASMSVSPSVSGGITRMPYHSDSTAVTTV